jgi:prepilin-type N-terminal cleavage/methylation domain-containing protein
MMIRQPKQLFPPETQSGFTIIECLLGIILVSILLTAIAPVIALSVATRVQARRVEQATQAAKSYIDGIRAGKIPSPAYTVTLNEVTPVPDPITPGKTTNNFTPQRETIFSQVGAPSSVLPVCPVPIAPAPTDIYPCQNDATATLYCINIDGNGCSGSSPRNFVVQALRSITPTEAAAVVDPTQPPKNGYVLAVRVYRADAFDGTVNLRTQAQMNAKAATYAGGRGNRSVPLVEMTTEIRDSDTSYTTLCQRLGGCNQ